jgi:hypothetical protein
MLQVILEHLGKGALVLVSTLVTEGLTIAAALYLFQTGGRLPALTMVMTAAAALTMLAFAIFFLRLVKRLGASHAV